MDVLEHDDKDVIKEYDKDVMEPGHNKDFISAERVCLELISSEQHAHCVRASFCRDLLNMWPVNNAIVFVIQLQAE